MTRPTKQATKQATKGGPLGSPTVPASPERWGKVAWTDDDLASALQEQGMEASPANIEALHESYYLQHITDSMIERGWENIYQAIAELRSKA